MAMIELHGAVVDVPIDGPEQAPSTRRLLGPVNLALSEHRVTVIGANGSGKSTLLRLLNGLVLPSSGHVTVNGNDTRNDGPAVRRQVAFAFTDPLSQLVMPTGREDVELSLRRVHRNRTDRRRTAEAVLDRFGLTRLADQSIYDLSGGERQLMALAAVLATEPEILVLDEPSTLLDLRNTTWLRRTISGLDQAVIMATHDLDLALDADRTLVVHEGALAFDGPPDEAVAHYRSLSAELP
jgi:biotin transport system ATP-binding protein